MIKSYRTGIDLLLLHRALYKYYIKLATDVSTNIKHVIGRNITLKLLFRFVFFFPLSLSLSCFVLQYVLASNFGLISPNKVIHVLRCVDLLNSSLQVTFTTTVASTRTSLSVLRSWIFYSDKLLFAGLSIYRHSTLSRRAEHVNNQQ